MIFLISGKSNVDDNPLNASTLNLQQYGGIFCGLGLLSAFNQTSFTEMKDR